MKIIPKDQILPFSPPWVKISTDRFREMNTFVYIEPNGNFIGLIRTINYIKYPDYSFNIWDYPSKSIYFKVEGNVADYDNWNYSPLSVEYGLPQYKTHWLGIEDVRMISESEILTVVPELNPRGSPQIFKASLIGSKVRDFKPLLPQFDEKNWMPFQDETTKVVYSVSPFTVRTLDSIELITIDPNPECQGYHGSSNGLRYRDGWLFLVHTTQDRRVIHRFIYLSTEYKIRVSTPFIFFRDSHIEFVSSLSSYDGKFWIGIGVNDERSYLVSFQESVVADLGLSF